MVETSRIVHYNIRKLVRTCEKMKQSGTWYHQSREVTGISYNCGYCGSIAAPSKGYWTSNAGYNDTGHIYICSNCNQPTYIREGTDIQIPGPIIGRNITHLPDSINSLYDEARKCITVSANTSAVLACRKILMNVAVQEGADEDKSFQFYVNYLETNNFLPPKGKGWVDRIRLKGNEATHEIAPMTQQDATELIGFVEMLLRFVYEFPAMVTHPE